MTVGGSIAAGRVALIAVLCICLGVAALGADHAAAVVQATAQAKPHKKHRCRPECRRVKAFRYLAKHRFSFSAGDGYSWGIAMNLDLCGDGRLEAHREGLIYRTGSYRDSWDGTWGVISASPRRVRVAYTTVDYRAEGYPPQWSGYPPPAAGVVVLGKRTQTSVRVVESGGLTLYPDYPLARTLPPAGSCPSIGAPVGG